MAGALEGLRVLDFSWVIVGPLTTKLLADHGATVIRVESPAKLDYLRSSAPFHEGRPGLNRSLFFNNANTSKLSFGLNLRREEGRALVRDIVQAWQPDIVVESFGTGVMDAWGLGYGDLQRIKPDLIYLGTTQFGTTGPYARYAGFGNIGAAVAGLNHLTGWPDGMPIGPWGALPDMTAPPMAIVALIAALDHRRRTGEGQRLELAQIEAFLHLFTPSLLDFDANGVVTQRAGNRDPEMAPHSVFPVRGDDRWVAIACRDDRDWAALRGVIAEGWAENPAYAAFAGRKAGEDALEAALAAWTHEHEGGELAARLQRAGVPAEPVQTPADLVADAQLRARGFFRTVEHAELGPIHQDGPHFDLSDTPASLRATPLLGEHNLVVLSGILGLNEERIQQLIADGVVESP